MSKLLRPQPPVVRRSVAAPPHELVQGPADLRAAEQRPRLVLALLPQVGHRARSRRVVGPRAEGLEPVHVRRRAAPHLPRERERLAVGARAGRGRDGSLPPPRRGRSLPMPAASSRGPRAGETARGARERGWRGVGGLFMEVGGDGGRGRASVCGASTGRRARCLGRAGMITGSWRRRSLVLRRRLTRLSLQGRGRWRDSRRRECALVWTRASGRGSRRHGCSEWCGKKRGVRLVCRVTMAAAAAAAAGAGCPAEWNAMLRDLIAACKQGGCGRVDASSSHSL